MKKVFLFVAALAVSVNLSAQMTSADKVVKATVGFGGYGLPIAVSYEQGVYDLANGAFITAGGYLGYAGKSNTVLGITTSYTNIFIAAQGNYYFKPIVDKLDLYAGLRLGYNVGSSRVEGVSASAGGLAYSLQFGASYYVSEKLAINAELGYGIGYLNAGISYKL